METERNEYLYRALSNFVLIFTKILTESSVINLTFDVKSGRVDKDDLMNTKILQLVNKTFCRMANALEGLSDDSDLKKSCDLAFWNEITEQAIKRGVGSEVLQGVANGKALFPHFSEVVGRGIEECTKEINRVKEENEVVKAKIAEELAKVRNLNSEIKKLLM